VLLVHGLFDTLYVDNGPSFQTTRFHAACKNEALDIKVVHSKPYVSEGRGVCERFNRTVKEQFESEVRNQEDLLTLRAGARSAVPGGAPARLRRGSAWTNPGTGGPVCAKRLRRAVVGTVLRLRRPPTRPVLLGRLRSRFRLWLGLGRLRPHEQPRDVGVR
jgi:transposase InsO family protein